MKYRKRKKVNAKLVAQTSYPIIIQTWADCEGQNIVIPECCWSVHLEEKDREYFINAFWEREKASYYQGRMPVRYLREEGPSSAHQTKERIFKRLVELRSKGIYGLWITHLELLNEQQQE